MKMVNRQPRYIVTIPSWRMNGKRLFPDEDILDVVIINETASRLRVRIDPANFTGDSLSFTCFLPLTGGGEDSATTVVDPEGNSTYRPLISCCLIANWIEWSGG